MLRQTLILKIYHLESIVSVLNLVTLPPLSNLINLLIKYEQYNCKKVKVYFIAFRVSVSQRSCQFQMHFRTKKCEKNFD
jgi:hypothetical protein